MALPNPYTCFTVSRSLSPSISQSLYCFWGFFLLFQLLQLAVTTNSATWKKTWGTVPFFLFRFLPMFSNPLFLLSCLSFHLFFWFSFATIYLICLLTEYAAKWVYCCLWFGKMSVYSLFLILKWVWDPFLACFGLRVVCATSFSLFWVLFLIYMFVVIFNCVFIVAPYLCSALYTFVSGNVERVITNMKYELLKYPLAYIV